MYCPTCGNRISDCCEVCARIDRGVVADKLKVPEDCLVCTNCLLTRPKVWWDSLKLDVNSVIEWPQEAKEELPEELTGHEAPWGD
jgi:hypothetical protein